ncbi:hypothetical protein BWX42_05525 [Dolosigranulum pigrum]|uniref:Uncharacterized protein n=1 Tax=Dolosigranulum pigrum TaxID=29394 RepID=A0A1S8KND8_9LACT|nr:hypothetical protein BWX42_05525 [Dolosigranulum pigrum]
MMTLGILVTRTVVNAEQAHDTVHENNEGIEQFMSEEDKIFFEKMNKVYNHFTLSDDGQLSLNISSSELVTEFAFTQPEAQRVLETVSSYNQELKSFKESGTVTRPRLHVEDWKIYLTNEDVKMYLSAAIQAGAPAVIAAVTSLGSVVPGIGSIIAAFTSVVSAGNIIYVATQALANGQGMVMGVDWNGSFPNPVVDTWG